MSGPAGKRWCNVGWRRNCADKDQDGSAEKRGGTRGTAVHSVLTLCGGGMARLRRAHAEAERQVEFRESGSQDAPRGVVCGHKQLPLFEKRKEQQKNDDTREV